MDNGFFSVYKVEDRSYVSFVKREIHNIVAKAGFSSLRTGEIDIIVAELTSNLIKHAQAGELLYRLAGEDENKFFEIFAIDNGPGTNDIARMIKDGASTANTLGNGLGAITRLSDVFQIYSQAGWGTVAYSKSFKQMLKPAFERAKTGVDVKALQVCYPGESVCGDGYFVKKNSTATQIFVGDGLGHGPHAFNAVRQAVEAFKHCNDTDDPIEVLRYIHDRVKKTRGLVGTIATLNHEKKQWKICGIGNIATRLCQGVSAKNYMSNNGIIGLNLPTTIHNYSAEAEHNQFIIMFSDGIKTRWELSKYPLLLKYDQSIIASVIFKDNARRNDDMTVLVGKVNL